MPGRFFFIACFVTTTFAVAQPPARRIALGGQWLFRSDPQKTGIKAGWFAADIDRSEWREVAVPKFWEEYPGLADYDGWGWFARNVTVDRVDEPMSIYCAGVDDDATVWINGVYIGTHTGYTDPFALDMGDALHTGENLIVIQVADYAGGGGIYKPITLVETGHLDELLRGPYFGKHARHSAEWVRDAVIYEVYLRSFSKEGTFAGLERQIPRLKDLGVTVLWLMPIHPVGVRNRKGTLGSPYSVRDYYAVNTEFGTMQDFRRLVEAVHHQKMNIIIDLVANHTAWDSKLIEEHPEWFTKDAEGNIVPPNADWTDVADLDYAQPGLRKYMIDMMRWWVQDGGIDGFRCDVAELVPTDFWNEARVELDKIKPVMMLSEGSLPEHHMEAFDITYSWNVYDALEPVLSGKRPVSLFDQILTTERYRFPTGSLRLRFNTNHDKNAWDDPAAVKFGEGLGVTAVLVNVLPGVPLIYNGEEAANRKKLSLFEKVAIDWDMSPTMTQLYRHFTGLRELHPALTRGAMIRLNTSYPEDVYALARNEGRDGVIAILNFSAQPRLAAVSVPFDSVFPGESSVTMREIFHGARTELSSRRTQIVVALEPYDYCVFVPDRQ